MRYTALDISQYVLKKCQDDNHPISNLQLQKILFFIQKDFIINHGEPLFDDDFEAWRFGPVIPSVYNRYCIFGAATIICTEVATTLSNQVKSIIDPIIKYRSSQDPWEMVRESHNAGGAWDSVYLDGKGNKKVIDKSIIKVKG